MNFQSILNDGFPFSDPVVILTIVSAIILFAPTIFRKLKIPGVVGLIIAGMAIGPNGGNLIASDSSMTLFSTIGLLYLMFLAGLEIVMDDFYQNKHKSIVFGVFTFIIPLVFGFAVTYYYFNLDFKAAILLASIFSTHTLISYPIASRLGVTKNRAVTVTIGGTIITDTAVLIVLAIVTASMKGDLNRFFWLTMMGKLVVFIALMMVLVPIISKWLLKRLQGESSIQYIYVFMLIFASGLFAKVSGVEPIIGAFMAGLALNRLIPHNSPLMNRIVFIGNTIFIPFFLISVGMIVDIKVLFHGYHTLYIAFILIVIGLLTKYIAAYLTQKSFGFTKTEGNLIFGLSSSHAAATIAVIMVGYRIGLFNEVYINAIILLILASCLTSSFVTEINGRKLALSSEAPGESIKKEKERILIPVSNPGNTNGLINFALLLKNAGDKEPVYPLLISPEEESLRQKQKDFAPVFEKSAMIAAATENTVLPIGRIDLHASQGIARAVKDMDISKTVIGWHGKTSTTDYLFGSVLDNLKLLTHKMIIEIKKCEQIKPGNTIFVFIPENAEYETGFADTIHTIQNLAVNLKSPLVFTGNELSISRLAELKKWQNAKFTHSQRWEKIFIPGFEIKHDDLLILVSARQRTISYGPKIEQAERILISEFEKNSFIIIYPEQKDIDVSSISTYLEGLVATPLQQNINQMGRMGDFVKNVITKSKMKGSAE